MSVNLDKTATQDALELFAPYIIIEPLIICRTNDGTVQATAYMSGTTPQICVAATMLRAADFPFTYTTRQMRPRGWIQVSGGTGTFEYKIEDLNTSYLAPDPILTLTTTSTTWKHLQAHSIITAWTALSAAQNTGSCGWHVNFVNSGAFSVMMESPAMGYKFVK